MPVVEAVKRPIKVTAVKWTGVNLEEVEDFAQDDSGKCFDVEYAGFGAEVWDSVQEVWIAAHVGDWIVKGIKGEFYPVNDAVFQETYDLAP